MSDTVAIGLLALVCIFFGFAKAFWPHIFLEFRERHPWVNLFDLYAFLYQSKHGKRVVEINRYLLLIVGFLMLLSLFFRK
jgi:hypothetical protein